VTTTEIRSIVEQIAEYEHMGHVLEGRLAQIDIILKSNSLSIYWDARFEGKIVRQAAFFKFTGIQLGAAD
jgi:hypothetical protein